MSCRVRYAPSPTGLQHIGGIRTALYNYFFAKSQGGKFILRVEDTDRTRYSEESLKDLYDTLDWLNIKCDEGPLVGGNYGPYIQSERFGLYQEYAKKLVQEGKAYYCFCSEERLNKVREEQQKTKSSYQGYDRHCRDLSQEEVDALLKEGKKPEIRLKVPLSGETTFHDVLMGDITRKNKDISPDPILLKSDGFPTYHLANVIDDHLMGITHIMRAQEWIPSGPLHVILYSAFGWEVPLYCHLPMVMGKDGKKLSKRHGSTSVRDFKEKGYLPEALINYVTLVGWAFDGEKQFFTKEELEKDFCLEKINKAPGVFDYKKLDWFNGQYIRMKTPEELCELLLPYLEKDGLISGSKSEETKLVLPLVPMIQERLKTLSDVSDLLRFLFLDPGVPEKESLVAKKHTVKQTYDALNKAYPILKKGLEEGKEIEKIEEELVEVSNELGIKVNGVFNPIRVSITGTSVSPPLFDCIFALGKEKSYERIERALTVLAE